MDRLPMSEAWKAVWSRQEKAGEESGPGTYSYRTRHEQKVAEFPNLKNFTGAYHREIYKKFNRQHKTGVLNLQFLNFIFLQKTSANLPFAKGTRAPCKGEPGKPNVLRGRASQAWLGVAM
jgi:hypothetical protein